MAIDKYGKMTPGEQEELLKAGSGNDLGLVVPLSEQDLIDCDVLYEKGCQGGLMTTTFEEEEHKQGICSEADYPFIATQGTCSTSLCTPVPGSIVKDHVDIVPRKNNALVEAVKVQPTTAAMVATDPMFQFYSSGIFSTPGCGRVTKSMGDEDCNMLYEGQDTCLPDINHGVLVVGYGKDDTVSGDVKEFFKVKNSWGEAWGEGGYFRLARYEADDKAPEDSWGECAILTLLSYPVMEGQA
jgi:C1A family cysteine protease